MWMHAAKFTQSIHDNVPRAEEDCSSGRPAEVFAFRSRSERHRVVLLLSHRILHPRPFRYAALHASLANCSLLASKCGLSILQLAGRRRCLRSSARWTHGVGAFTWFSALSVIGRRLQQSSCSCSHHSLQGAHRPGVSHCHVITRLVLRFPMHDENGVRPRQALSSVSSDSLCA